MYNQGTVSMGGGMEIGEQEHRICSGKVSERQSSFDGGLPFPAPGNVDHINRPKSMMMLMLRLIIEKLTPHLVTATSRHLIRRRSKVRKIEGLILLLGLLSSVSSTTSAIHLMRRRRKAPPCSVSVSSRPGGTPPPLLTCGLS